MEQDIYDHFLVRGCRRPPPGKSQPCSPLHSSRSDRKRASFVSCPALAGQDRAWFAGGGNKAPRLAFPNPVRRQLLAVHLL